VRYVNTIYGPKLLVLWNLKWWLRRQWAKKNPLICRLLGHRLCPDATLWYCERCTRWVESPYGEKDV
jgi:hypothetical protein